jgi:hypothetical protein
MFNRTARRVEVGRSDVWDWGTASLFRMVPGDENPGSILKLPGSKIVAS